MTLAKSVLGIVPGLQATALVGLNLKAAQQNFNMKPSKKMNMQKATKNIVRAGVGTLIGVALMRPTASMINKL